MQYNLDIKDSYQQFICLDSDVGLSAYYSFPALDIINTDSVIMHIDNLEVNMSDSKWFSPVIIANTKSIISNGLREINTNEPDCIYSIILSKSILKITNIKCIYMSINQDGIGHYHSSGTGFDTGDHFIWLAGKSADISSAQFSAMIVFSGEGEIEISFEEKDIIIHSVGLNQNITPSEASVMNTLQEFLVSKKQRNLKEMGLNNIKSNFLDFDFYNRYFKSDENGNIAYKSFPV